MSVTGIDNEFAALNLNVEEQQITNTANGTEHLGEDTVKGVSLATRPILQGIGSGVGILYTILGLKSSIIGFPCLGSSLCVSGTSTMGIAVTDVAASQFEYWV